MSTLEKILNILKMKNNPKSYSVKFYAEMKLDDGRVVATEDEQFMIGSKVFAIGDDGEAEALSAGTYTMENGNKLTIGDSSEILDLGEEAESVEEESKEEVEASAELSEETNEEEIELAEDDEAVVEDWAGMEKRIKNLEDAVADLKADKESKKDADKEEKKVEEDAVGMSAQNLSQDVKTFKHNPESKVETKLNIQYGQKRKKSAIDNVYARLFGNN